VAQPAQDGPGHLVVDPGAHHATEHDQHGDEAGHQRQDLPDLPAGGLELFRRDAQAAVEGLARLLSSAHRLDHDLVGVDVGQRQGQRQVEEEGGHGDQREHPEERGRRAAGARAQPEHDAQWRHRSEDPEPGERAGEHPGDEARHDGGQHGGADPVADDQHGQRQRDEEGRNDRK
jgi:hypothetical protein